MPSSPVGDVRPFFVDHQFAADELVAITLRRIVGAISLEKHGVAISPGQRRDQPTPEGGMAVPPRRADCEPENHEFHDACSNRAGARLGLPAAMRIRVTDAGGTV